MLSRCRKLSRFLLSSPQVLWSTASVQQCTTEAWLDLDHSAGSSSGRDSSSSRTSTRPGTSTSTSTSISSGTSRGTKPVRGEDGYLPLRDYDDHRTNRLQYQNRVLSDLLALGYGKVSLEDHQLYWFVSAMSFVTSSLDRAEQHRPQEARLTPRFMQPLTNQKFQCGYSLHAGLSAAAGTTCKASETTCAVNLQAYLLDRLANAPPGTGIKIQTIGPKAAETTLHAIGWARGRLRSKLRDAYCIVRAENKQWRLQDIAPGFYLEMTMYVVDRLGEAATACNGPRD